MRRYFAKSAAASVAAIRQMVVYSQQSPVLIANQASRNSDSNMWIEEWELPRLGLAVNPQDNIPTSVTITKQLELFNADLLESPLDVIEAPQHFSYATRKPYGTKLQLELSDRAMKSSFVSKAWLSRGSIKKDGLSLKQNARPAIVLTSGAVRLFHVSQLVGAVDQLAYWPVSGGTRRFYAKESEQFNALSQSVIDNQFSSALFFSTKQLETLQLHVKQDATAIQLASTGNANNQFAFFNVDQLVGPEEALVSLNRVEPSVDSFLLTGEAIQLTALLPKHFQSKYWISARDCQMYKFQIKPEELNNGVVLSASRNSTHLFNVDQLVNPEQGFQKAGLVTR